MTVTASVTRDVTGSSRPARLGARGRRLWEQMTDGVQLSPAERVLVEEACRIADRLERLDSVLAGESDRWMEFKQDLEGGGPVVVYIDRILSEARQQAVSLKQIVGELRQLRAAASTGPVQSAQPSRPAVPASAADGVGGNGVSGVASLTARIAAKRGISPAG